MMHNKLAAPILILECIEWRTKCSAIFAQQIYEIVYCLSKPNNGAKRTERLHTYTKCIYTTELGYNERLGIKKLCLRRLCEQTLILARSNRY